MSKIGSLSQHKHTLLVFNCCFQCTVFCLIGTSQVTQVPPIHLEGNMFRFEEPKFPSIYFCHIQAEYQSICRIISIRLEGGGNDGNDSGDAVDGGDDGGDIMIVWCTGGDDNGADGGTVASEGDDNDDC